MNELEPEIQRAPGGEVTKVTVDARVSVVSEGEGIEQQAVLLFGGGEHSLPVNLADVLKDYFGSGQEDEARWYGPLRITIERNTQG